MGRPALLAWCSVVRDGGKTAGQDLWNFWDDMSATSPSDAVLNAWTVHGYRALSSFVAPEVSPYRFPATEASGMARRKLRKTIEDHIDFDAIPRLVGEHSGELPMLFVGAVDVLSGRFRVFRNMRDTEPPDRYGKIELQLEVTADAIMASAAVPTLFRTARAEHNGEEHLYWDGLFSQNPPVRDLPDARPDQIWVLQINPTKRGTEPEDMGAIRDRRNELAGNLSLRQEMHFIEKINKIVRGCRKETGIAVDASWEMLEIDREQNPRTRSYKEIELFCIEIPEEAAGLRLDTESKLDRDPRFIRKLFDTGVKEAGTFLDRLNGKGKAAGPDYRWKDDD